MIRIKLSFSVIKIFKRLLSNNKEVYQYSRHTHNAKLKDLQLYIARLGL